MSVYMCQNLSNYTLNTCSLLYINYTSNCRWGSQYQEVKVSCPRLAREMVVETIKIQLLRFLNKCFLHLNLRLFASGFKKDLKRHKIWHERKKRIMLKKTYGLTYLSQLRLEIHCEFIWWKSSMHLFRSLSSHAIYWEIHIFRKSKVCVTSRRQLNT